MAWGGLHGLVMTLSSRCCTGAQEGWIDQIPKKISCWPVVAVGVQQVPQRLEDNGANGTCHSLPVIPCITCPRLWVKFHY